MKKLLPWLRSIILVMLSSLLFTSCQAVEDIFSAGFYVGIFVVVILIIIVIAIVIRMDRK